MARLFVERDPTDPHRGRLDADGARHLRALRLVPGDAFEAVVAPGEVHQATLEAYAGGGAHARLGVPVDVGDVDPARPLILVVALADLTRFDTVVEKATELGASQILPLRAERSQIGQLRDARRQRWSRIARRACEQCGRTCPPEIGEEASLESVCAHLPGESRRIVLDPRAREAWTGDVPGDRALVLFVGPEGGFTPRELQFLQEEAGAVLRSLGPRVLRFETAAAAALAIAGMRGAGVAGADDDHLK